MAKIMEFILSVNQTSNYFEVQSLWKNQNLSTTFTNSFVKDFHFLFDLESRFYLLRSQFNFYENNYFGSFKIDRRYILEQGTELYAKLLKIPSLTGTEKFSIIFIDETGNIEAGIDQGGLYKDFVDLYTGLIFNPDFGYFVEQEQSRELFINPSVKYWQQEDSNQIYEIIGFVIARCFFEGFTLNKKLSRTFIRKIMKLPNFFKELQYFDESLYEQLKKIKTSENVEDYDLNFTVAEKDSQKEVELIPNGANIQVTKNNVLQYIYSYADYKMNIQVKKQFEQFYKGFRRVFDMSLLNLFSEQEVQLLLNGTEEEIDFDDLKDNSKWDRSWQMEQFWSVVKEFNQRQRKQLLKFITNYERPPLFGFKNLHPKILIKTIEYKNQLPSSSTCANVMYLPEYPSV